MKFDQNFSWNFNNSHGPFHIRAINENDKNSLLLGFEHTSKESRLKRFLTIKKELTDKEVLYLTHPDFINHFAYGIEKIENNKRLPFGVARFVRDPDNYHRAECAITLIDEFQGQGLGSILFEVLVNAAIEADIQELYGQALADNTAIFNLMRKFGEFSVIVEKGIANLSLKLC